MCHGSTIKSRILVWRVVALKERRTPSMPCMISFLRSSGKGYMQICMQPSSFNSHTIKHCSQTTQLSGRFELSWNLRLPHKHLAGSDIYGFASKNACANFCEHSERNSISLSGLKHANSGMSLAWLLCINASDGFGRPGLVYRPSILGTSSHLV